VRGLSAGGAGPPRKRWLFVTLLAFYFTLRIPHHHAHNESTLPRFFPPKNLIYPRNTCDLSHMCPPRVAESTGGAIQRG
jgi:hypothetical protein